MHDRRIDGETAVFGNATSLFMSAMTWWDHTTESIWSQPWGRAIEGSQKGVELFLLPSQVTTWSAWRAEHPQTVVMINDFDRLANLRQTFDENFVIGVTLADEAKAYRFTEVAEVTLINDMIGETAVLVWASETSFHTYVRVAESIDEPLTFYMEGDQIKDEQAGSVWDISLGLAVEGPLRNTILPALPSLTAFEENWFDFYPHAALWQSPTN
ncbi:hypothetical protein MNBD_CHLOROFLEXI01-5142 [hydrothermal vent metagenome]|uniref:DUF3179 domain-containing protein n=1 Tax=hydrothermal vent metagenome TaxID=652676 RepID=A0A3B0VSS8_9ZZZZ